jgi:hypothetical protein
LQLLQLLPQLQRLQLLQLQRLHLQRRPQLKQPLNKAGDSTA